MKDKRFKKLLCFLIFLILPEVGQADVTFPARLDITESSPGVYEVQLVLPVYKGQVLRADVVWPEVCTRLSNHQVGGDQFTKWERWTATCDKSMVGQTIGVDGLLGSPINIMLTYTSLDGRKIQEILSPVNAFYVIPEPIGLFSLARQAIADTFILALRNGFLYLVILIYYMRSQTWMKLETLALFLFTLFISITAIAFGVLRIPLILSEQLLMLFAILAILRRTKPLVLHNYSMLVISAIFLASTIESQIITTNLTLTDTWIISLSHSVGVVSATCVALVFTAQLAHFISKIWRERILMVLATVLTGLLLYGLSIYTSYPFPTTNIPLAALGMTVFLGLTVRTGYKGSLWPLILGFTLLLLVGLTLGLAAGSAYFVPGLTLLTAGCWLICRLLWEAPIRWMYILPLLLTLLIGWYLGGKVKLHSLDLWAEGVTDCVLLTTTFAFTCIITRTGLGSRSLGYMAAALLTLLITQYLIAPVITVFEQVRSGRILLPIVSMILIVAGIYLWPKRLSLRQQLGAERKKPAVSLILLLIAMVSLPYFQYAITTPGHDPSEYRMAEDRRLVRNLLESTYTAFNLENEDQLFEALSVSVDERLMEHIYLDSRRRMQAGTLSGSKVTIQEVEVLDLVSERTNPADRSFQVTWIVVARVRHPTHTHFRRNKYQGKVLLREIGDQWKIGDISLQAESRQIIGRS